MIYLDQFKLPSHVVEDSLLKMQGYMSDAGYTDNPYPCHIFVQKQLSSLDFKEITILYGGNGSGKSTLLNLITKKLTLKLVDIQNVTIQKRKLILQKMIIKSMELCIIIPIAMT